MLRVPPTFRASSRSSHDLYLTYVDSTVLPEVDHSVRAAQPAVCSTLSCAHLSRRDPWKHRLCVPDRGEGFLAISGTPVATSA
jgi:hypothetical protein